MDESLTNRSTTRSAWLDVLRVVAIVIVFAFHFPKVNGVSVFGPYARFGWIGVDLFFVLSGYLIGTQILKAVMRDIRFEFQKFYLSRLLRTLPAYLIVLALYFFFPLLREKPLTAPAWRFLTFTQNFGDHQTAFSHAWSLCVEEQFYLVCPLLLIAVVRINRRWVSGLVVASLFAFGLLYRLGAWLEFSNHASNVNRWDRYLDLLYFPTWARLDGLLCGVILAALLVYSPRLKRALEQMRVLALPISAIVVTSACFLLSDRTSWSASVFGYPLLSFGFMVLIGSAATSDGYNRVLRKIRIGELAILTYGFYLVHKSVVHVLTQISPMTSDLRTQAFIAAASFVVSYGFAYVLYQAVERPVLLLRDRWLAKRTTVYSSSNGVHAS